MLVVIMIAFALVFLIMNSLFSRSYDKVIFTAYHWFLQSILICAMAVIHFPVTLLSSLFVWPVITNVRYMFGFLDKNTNKLEWLARMTVFFGLIIFGIVALFGTILFEGINSFE